MSRIRLNIDRLVLRGFEPLEGKALSEALQSQLSEVLSAEVLSDRATRTNWAHRHRTSVLKLGRMSLDPSTAGARKLGRQVARAVATGLKP